MNVLSLSRVGFRLFFHEAVFLFSLYEALKKRLVLVEIILLSRFAQHAA